MKLPLNFQEQVMFSLRGLYERQGYSRYKMSKFEEYDLYAQNKDFLIDRSVITFMDTNGKLMALKPDVTLSIVKNSQDNQNTLQKLYYNENVYRVSPGSRSFRELMQVGLECLGSIDDCCICEVLTLAAESLAVISPDWVLDISHLGLLESVLTALGIPAERTADAFRCISQKNSHELAVLCNGCGISPENTVLLKEVATLCGSPASVLPRLTGLADPAVLSQLRRITAALEQAGYADRIRFDFSAVDDPRYYNGFVFKGFIHGLPQRVLSGGQYDKLMQKMNRRCGAIGFAVYMDALERLELPRTEADVDTILLYHDSTPLDTIQTQLQTLFAEGRSVMVQRQVPENIRFNQIITL